MPAPELGDRSLFSSLRATVYANHAGMSPLAEPVAHALHEAVDELAAEGGAAGWRYLGLRDRVREQIAALVGALPHEIGLVPNTTSGVRAAAFALPWQPGDRVVCFTGEFPANVTPWQLAAARFGGEVVMLPLEPYYRDRALALQQLRDVLAQGRVRAVAVSAVQFQTGLRMPIAAMAEVAHAAGAWLCVDAIQACGVVPIDMRAEGIDVLACGSHKWLGAPMGLGFWAVRDAVIGHMRPLLAGWTSHEGAADFLLQGAGHLRYDRPIAQRASFVEDGGFAIANVPALAAALEILHALGPAAIHRHVQSWIDGAESILQRRGFASMRSPNVHERSGIASFHVPSGVDVIALHAALEKRGLACATPDGLLRLSPHWSNALAELPRVAAIVDAALAEARPAAR
jgi:selenocysteine lyase/cysteine desulfurase